MPIYSSCLTTYYKSTIDYTIHPIINSVLLWVWPNCTLSDTIVQSVLTDCYTYYPTGDSTVPHWWDGIYVNSITPPCIRTLDNFSVYKRTNAFWQSKPFYTSVDGYKLQLNVDANGYGSGAGTHLSLGVHLMKGDNDDKLSFPLNATITVQILNILSDSNHRERTFNHYKAPVDARTRVTVEDIAPGGRGLHFISHTELLDNTNNSIKFIDNDKLYIRIVSVDIIRYDDFNFFI